MRLNALASLIPGMSLVLFAGCARDFGNPPRPDIEVVEPDLTIVQSATEIGLSLRIDSPRDIDRVTVEGRDLSFDTATSTWMGIISLEAGYNRLDVRSQIGDEPPFADTLNAFRANVTVEVLDQAVAPHPVGAHSVTDLADGGAVLIGGGSTVAGSGFAGISTRDPGETLFLLRPWRLNSGRLGHTTTLLPDGRLLILGGAVVGDIPTTDQLVSEVEIFDPADNSIAVVPVVGAPVLRVYHTAVLRNNPERVIVDLLGGRGNIRSGDTPEIGIRRDLRSFELAGDTLFALHPAIGPFVEPLAGHTQTALGPSASASADEFLVAGMTFGEMLEPAALFMDYGAPFGIDITDVAPPVPGTIRHAAVRLDEGVIAVLGGRGEDPADVRDTIAIYAVEADRWFTVDESRLMNFIPRYGHTATEAGPNRILVLGGFDANGNALTEPRIVSFDIPDD